MWCKVFASCLVVLGFLTLANGAVLNRLKRATKAEPTETKVRSLKIDSTIKSRFATTHVTSEVENLANESREIQFVAQLPADAFVSNFTMEIDGRLEIGEVKDKVEAKRDYEEAKQQGNTAGLVAQKPRETNMFETSVNVRGGGSVKFDLTYQEVLKRVHGVYKHVVNIVSAEGVEDIEIKVVIQEKGKVNKIHVPKFAPKIGEKTNKELLALSANPDVVVRTSETDGVSTSNIVYTPPSDGSGQLAVLYDLERSSDGGAVEVVDGYFVHFFAPEPDNFQSSANIVFVLDRSGSMSGRKFEQLKTAMNTIFDEMNEADFFNVVWFSTDVQVWQTNLQPASAANINNAKQFINGARATGGTNIHGALMKGLSLLSQNTENVEAPKMVIFLTDGLATAGEIQDDNGIVEGVKTRNGPLNAHVHCLAFGNDADFTLLKRISSDNKGLARKIYEASDAALQIDGFYTEIANPLFMNVDISYLNSTVDVGSLVKSRDDDAMYSGGEVMVVGKLADPANAYVSGEVRATQADGAPAFFRCGNMCYWCCTEPSRPCAPWCRCPPFPPPPPPTPAPLQPADTLGGFIERMWAYMTIKKLLKEAELNSGEAGELKKQAKELSLKNIWACIAIKKLLKEAELNSGEAGELKKQAKELSLKYHFVTELTSLVIVDKQSKIAPVTEELPVPESRLPYGNLGSGGSALGLRGPSGARPASGSGYQRLMPTEMFATRRMPAMTWTWPTTTTTTTTPPTTTTTVSRCTLNLMVVADERSTSGMAASYNDLLMNLIDLLQLESNLDVAISVVALTDGSSGLKVRLYRDSVNGLDSIPDSATGDEISSGLWLDQMRSSTVPMNNQAVLVFNGEELLPAELLGNIRWMNNQGGNVVSAAASSSNASEEKLNEISSMVSLTSNNIVDGDENSIYSAVTLAC